jgi:thiomorpholine-carboxylate dehydrogenase
MLSSTIVAESRQGSENESAEVRLSGAQIYAEIGQVLSGSAQVPAGKRIVFKSLGMAIEDLTAARIVWQAREARPV